MFEMLFFINFLKGLKILVKFYSLFYSVGDCDPIADRNPKRPDRDQKFLNGLRSGVGLRIGSKQSQTLIFDLNWVC
jgi:hypothetical protein